jgi:hypothetical protein
MVEQHHAIRGGQASGDQPPQILVAPEAVRQHHHRPLLRTGESDVVPAEDTVDIHHAISLIFAEPKFSAT